MEKLFQKTVRHYQTFRHSFQQLTAASVRRRSDDAVGRALVQILQLARDTIVTVTKM